MMTATELGRLIIEQELKRIVGPWYAPAGLHQGRVVHHDTIGELVIITHTNLWGASVRGVARRLIIRIDFPQHDFAIKRYNSEYWRWIGKNPMTLRSGYFGYLCEKCY